QRCELAEGKELLPESAPGRLLRLALAGSRGVERHLRPNGQHCGTNGQWQPGYMAREGQAAIVRLAMEQHSGKYDVGGVALPLRQRRTILFSPDRQWPGPRSLRAPRRIISREHWL